MPENYVRAYVKLINESRDYYDMINIDNRDTSEKYSQHLDLKKLITDREREEKRLKIEARLDVPISPNATSPNLYKKQPRNSGIENYNFEQFHNFTRVYNEQMEKDRQKQYEIMRIFKYIKHNPDKELSKSWKKQLLFGPGSEEVNVDKFVDESVDITGFKPPVSKRLRRQIIRSRTSKDISSRHLEFFI